MDVLVNLNGKVQSVVLISPAKNAMSLAFLGYLERYQ
jgi:hypothetical protein